MSYLKMFLLLRALVRVAWAGMPAIDWDWLSFSTKEQKVVTKIRKNLKTGNEEKAITLALKPRCPEEEAIRVFCLLNAKPLLYKKYLQNPSSHLLTASLILAVEEAQTPESVLQQIKREAMGQLGKILIAVLSGDLNEDHIFDPSEQIAYQELRNTNDKDKIKKTIRALINSGWEPIPAPYDAKRYWVKLEQKRNWLLFSEPFRQALLQYPNDKALIRFQKDLAKVKTLTINEGGK